jgi:hypothetical protein
MKKSKKASSRVTAPNQEASVAAAASKTATRRSGQVECGGERRKAAVPEESGARDPRPYAGERTTTTGEAGRSLT